MAYDDSQVAGELQLVVDLVSMEHCGSIYQAMKLVVVGLVSCECNIVRQLHV